MWSIAELADVAAAALVEEDRRAAEEQSVRGVDHLAEVELHPLLAAAFVRAGFGVERERRYPAGRAARRETEGDRCDLVLAPGGLAVAPVGDHGTLFTPAAAAGDEMLFWLEVKLAAQFGPEGPNGAWSADLVARPRQDLRKLAREPAVRHRGLLLVIFSREQAIIEHDLAVAVGRFADALPCVGFPATRIFPVRDRIGHACGAVSIVPVLSHATADRAGGRRSRRRPRVADLHGGRASGGPEPGPSAGAIVERVVEPVPGADLRFDDV